MSNRRVTANVAFIKTVQVEVVYNQDYLSTCSSNIPEFSGKVDFLRWWKMVPDF